MTVGKGIGGGLALAAVLGREDVMPLDGGTHTSTFLTNALNAGGLRGHRRAADEAPGGALAVLGIARARALRAGLEGNPRVGEVRGRGLFIGIELGETRDHGARRRRGGSPCATRGLIVGATGATATC